MSTVITSRASQSLASGALSHAVTIGENLPQAEYELVEVAIKFSGTVSQTATVTRQSGPGGSNYAPVLDTATLSSAATYVYRPSPAAPLVKGDIVTVAVTNSGTPAVTAYSEVRYRKVS